MGVLRSCYKTQARFYRTGPVHEIRWFFAAPGAKWYDKPHIFHPLSQELEFKRTEGVGELTTHPRTYSKGVRPPGRDGREWHGSEADFLGETDYPGADFIHEPACVRPKALGLGAVWEWADPNFIAGLGLSARSLFLLNVPGFSSGDFAASLGLGVVVVVPGLAPVEPLLGLGVAVVVPGLAPVEPLLGLGVAVVVPGIAPVEPLLGLGVEAGDVKVYDPDGEVFRPLLGIGAEAGDVKVYDPDGEVFRPLLGLGASFELFTVDAGAFAAALGLGASLELFTVDAGAFAAKLGLGASFELFTVDAGAFAAKLGLGAEAVQMDFDLGEVSSKLGLGVVPANAVWRHISGRGFVETPIGITMDLPPPPPP